MAACAAQIPYFNAGIFLENKTQIGKVEEILGPINNVVSCGAVPQQAAKCGLLSLATRATCVCAVRAGACRAE
eukprot:137164-Chlamydomonas_euryale.AAC.1